MTAYEARVLRALGQWCRDFGEPQATAAQVARYVYSDRDKHRDARTTAVRSALYRLRGVQRVRRSVERGQLLWAEIESAAEGDEAGA